jgi:parallel beta-helix repeat protein
MLDVRALYRAAHPSGRRALYVSSSGKDTNAGTTLETAKRTVQAAVDMSQAGDRILVANGTYSYTQFYGKNGSPTAWISLENYPGSSPVIDVSRSVNSYDSTKLTNGIDIQLSSYIGLFGIEIRGSQTSKDPNPSGIGIFRASQHVAVWSCNIHDFPGGGVNCFYVAPTPFGGLMLPGGGWDAVDVFFNTVHDTSKYSPMNTSGISFYGGQDLTGATIDGTYGYRAVGNYVYNIVCTVPYTAGGFDFVTDGNGISPDSLAVPNNLNPRLEPYLKRGLIDSNVIVACGGRGVHIYNSNNIDVINNTLVGNLRTKSPAIDGSTEVDLALDVADSNNGVVIANNLIAPLHTTRAFDRSAQTVTANTAVGGTDAVPYGNQSLRPLGVRIFPQPPTASMLAAGLAVTAFVPVVNTWVPRRSGSSGFGALGSARDPGSTVVVGALQHQ